MTETIVLAVCIVIALDRLMIINLSGRDLTKPRKPRRRK